MANANIVQGILYSEAAIAIENAFGAVLGMSPADLVKLSPDDKFGKYCDDARLSAVLDYIRFDGGGGLPAMNPARTIHPKALTGIDLDSKLRLLVLRLSTYAYYPI